MNNIEEAAKQLLKQLCDITDEDLKELSEIVGFNGFDLQKDEEGLMLTDYPFSVCIYFTGVVLMYNYKKPIWNHILKIYQYLESRNYSLPRYYPSLPSQDSKLKEEFESIVQSACDKTHNIHGLQHDGYKERKRNFINKWYERAGLPPTQ